MGQKQTRSGRQPVPTRRQPLNLPKPSTRTPRDRKASYYPATSETQLALPVRHRNPLTDAASAGDLDSVLSILIMRDFDVNILSEAGETALHLATRRQDIHMIEALLARGAAPNVLDGNGFTPLHHLVCNADAIVTPMATGRPVGTPSEIMLMLIRYGADINATSFDGVSVLHEALRNKKVNEATTLIQKGAHFESRSTSGDTPLHEACRCNDTILVDAIIKSKFYTLQIPRVYWPHWGIQATALADDRRGQAQAMDLSHPTPVQDYVAHLRRGPPIKRYGPPPTLCTAVPLFFLRSELVVSLVDRSDAREYEKVLRQLGAMPPSKHQSTTAAAAAAAALLRTRVAQVAGVSGVVAARNGLVTTAPKAAFRNASFVAASVGQLPSSGSPALAPAPVPAAPPSSPRRQLPSNPAADATSTQRQSAPISVDVLLRLFDLTNEYSSIATTQPSSSSRHNPDVGDGDTTTSSTNYLAPSLVQSTAAVSSSALRMSQAGGGGAMFGGTAQGDDDAPPPTSPTLENGQEEAADSRSNFIDVSSDEDINALQAPKYVMPAYGRLQRGMGCPLDFVGKDGKTPLGCCDGWQGDKKLILMLLVARTTILLTDEILL